MTLPHEANVQAVSDILLLNKVETEKLRKMPSDHLEAVRTECSVASPASLRLVRSVVISAHDVFIVMAAFLSPLTERIYPELLEDDRRIVTDLIHIGSYMNRRIRKGRTNPTIDGMDNIGALSRGAYLVQSVLGNSLIEDTMTDDDLMWMGTHYEDVIPVLPELRKRRTCDPVVVREMVEGARAMSGGVL